MEVPTQPQIVPLLTPAPVLKEPAADPIRLMPQQQLKPMVVDQPQRSSQAAADAGCRASIERDPSQLLSMLRAGLGIRQSRAESCSTAEGLVAEAMAARQVLKDKLAPQSASDEAVHAWREFNPFSSSSSRCRARKTSSECI